MANLQVGSTVPSFTLADQDGHQVALSQLLKGAPLVLYVYPEAGTKSCTVQACQFNDALPALGKLHAAVVGLSPDQPAKLASFAEKHGLKFPLLADPPASDGVPPTINALGCWAEKSMYGKKYMGVVRTTFVIDARGRVAAKWENVRVPGHEQAVLDALQDLHAGRAADAAPAKPSGATAARTRPKPAPKHAAKSNPQSKSKPKSKPKPKPKPKSKPKSKSKSKSK